MTTSLLNRVTDRGAVIIFSVMASFWVILVYASPEVLLGGEGNFVFEWGAHASKYGGTYLAIGYGMPSLIPNVMGLETLIFTFVSKLDPSLRLQSVTYLLLLFVAPVVSFYIFARSVLQAAPYIALLTSILYLYNGFGLTYVQSMNVWNNLSLVTIPAFASAAFALRQDVLKGVFLIGSMAMILAFTLYNPPTLIISCICIFLLLATAIIGRESNVFSPNFIKDSFKLGVFGFSFLLFSMPWIIVTLIEMNHGTHDAIFTKSWAVNWGDAVSGASIFNLPRGIFGILFLDTSQRIFSFLVPLAVMQIILVTFLFSFSYRSDQAQVKLIAFLMIFFGVLAAGSAGPIGFIYSFMMEYIPYFYIFKTPNEKFSIAWVICFATLATFWLQEQPKAKYRQYVIMVFIIYGICTAYSVKGISEYNSGSIKVSRWLSITKDDKLFLDTANNLIPPNSAILRIPGGLNYQTMLRVDDHIYTGLDYVLNNTVGREIRPDVDPEIYTFYKHPEFRKKLCDRKIDYIYMNSDEIFWFGRAINESNFLIYKYLNKINGDPVLIQGNHYLWDINCDND